MQDDTDLEIHQSAPAKASSDGEPKSKAASQVDDDDAVDSLADTEALSEAERRAAELSEKEKLLRIQSLKPIVEGALMAAGEALKPTKIQSLFDEHDMPSKGLLLETMSLIKEECEGRGFTLIEVASGWRFQVREDYAHWINRLWDERPQKYSRALLETLALVAYRQPITRGDIEEVRGVAVSSHIMKTLTEREWVKVVGHRDVPGRPALYATTRQFLDYFNMKSLDELPTLGELKDVDSLNASLALDEEPIDSSPAEDGDTTNGESLSGDTDDLMATESSSEFSEMDQQESNDEDESEASENTTIGGPSLFDDAESSSEKKETNDE